MLRRPLAATGGRRTGEPLRRLVQVDRGVKRPLHHVAEPAPRVAQALRSADNSSRRANQLRRARERVKAHTQLAEEARDHGMTILEVSTVKPPTARKYQEALGKFTTWARGIRQRCSSGEEVDRLLPEYLETLYFQGEQNSAGDALLAAIKYLRPQWCDGPNDLPRGRRAMRGFRRLTPGQSRAPMPWAALLAVLGSALWNGDDAFALAVFLQFH